MTVNNIYKFIDNYAPFNLQENWDNSGLLVGSKNTEITGILVALDATATVIKEAKEKNCNLIVTHHPIIFGSYKNVLAEDITGSNIISLIKSGISVISVHTNLDKVLINDVLINSLGASDFTAIDDYLRIGTVKSPMKLMDYVSFVKSSLNNSGVRYYDSGRDVKVIGSVGGAGCDWLQNAFDVGCDTFITSDIKHHEWLAAKQLGINLIDADHFNTENCAIPELFRILKEEFPELPIYIADNNIQVVNYG